MLWFIHAFVHLMTCFWFKRFIHEEEAGKSDREDSKNDSVLMEWNSRRLFSLGLVASELAGIEHVYSKESDISKGPDMTDCATRYQPTLTMQIFLTEHDTGHACHKQVSTFRVPDGTNSVSTCKFRLMLVHSLATVRVFYGVYMTLVMTSFVELICIVKLCHNFTSAWRNRFHNHHTLRKCTRALKLNDSAVPRRIWKGMSREYVLVFKQLS